MSKANVDPAELRRFALDLKGFTGEIGVVVGQLHAKMGARGRSWLESEQASFWQGQLRKRTEAVAKAKDAVRQKKLYKDATGRTPTAIDEEKHLARCLVAVAQAQEKIEAVKRAIPRLEKE